MTTTEDANVAFYHLNKHDIVVFFCGESITGNISAGDNQGHYNINYVIPKNMEQKSVFGHVRIIDFMKNHSPKLSFIVSEESIKYCSGYHFEIEYSDFINTNPYFTWKNIKEPIKSSDLCSPLFHENKIVVLRAFVDLKRNKFNDMNELEADIRNNFTVSVEEIPHEIVGTRKQSMADALKDLNDRFNDYIERTMDEDFGLNINFVEVSGKSLTLPRTSIIGWMMSHDFRRTLKKSITNNINFGKFYISQFFNHGGEIQ